MFKTNLKLNIFWRMMSVMTLLLASFSGAFPVQAQGSTPNAPLLSPQMTEIIPNQYIVVYKDGLSTASSADDIQAAVRAQGGEVKFVYHAALNGYSAYLPADALAAVRANPAVKYVAADAMIHLDAEETSVAETTVTQPGAVWGIDRIDQHGLPLSGSYTYNKTGTGVNVYVIDTGIRVTHVQFEGRATLDFDSINDGQGGNDCHGHGTHVAGTIGSAQFGVAKNVHLHAVRVLGCSGGASFSQVIAGVDWVAANHVSPAVANMSLGGYGYDPLDVAINNLINSGVTLVVSAGNSNTSACNYSPARVPNAITVGATDVSDMRSTFSNWGVCVDIFAPGTDITSTWIGSDVDTSTISGTSMASPHVTGVAALYLEDHPNATPLEVRNAIVDTATRNHITDAGTGSVNRLLYSLFGPVSPIPDPYQPDGQILDSTPSFTWSQVTGAAQYQIELVRNGALLYTKNIAATACANRVCTYNPTNILPSGDLNSYKWRVKSLVSGVWNVFSLYKKFSIFKVAKAFNSQFVGTKDWTPITGTWDIKSNTYYHTTGVYGYVVSSAHTGGYSTIDYQVSMRREGCASCPNMVYVRGNPTKLGSANNWENGYMFEYTNTQYISIWAFVDGYYYPIQYWTYAPMVKTLGFNIIRVKAVGDQLRYYINNKLVWSGIDPTLLYGKVGVAMFKDGSGGTHLYVDWATLGLGVSSMDATSETVASDLGPVMTNWKSPYKTAP